MSDTAVSTQRSNDSWEMSLSLNGLETFVCYDQLGWWTWSQTSTMVGRARKIRSATALEMIERMMRIAKQTP